MDNFIALWLQWRFFFCSSTTSIQFQRRNAFHILSIASLIRFPFVSITSVIWFCVCPAVVTNRARTLGYAAGKVPCQIGSTILSVPSQLFVLHSDGNSMFLSVELDRQSFFFPYFIARWIVREEQSQRFNYFSFSIQFRFSHCQRRWMKMNRKSRSISTDSLDGTECFEKNLRLFNR